MADDQQQIEGLPEGATLRPVQPTQPAASDPSQVEGLPEGATLRPVTPPAAPTAPKAPAAPRAHAAPAPVVKGAVAPPAPKQDFLTDLDEHTVLPQTDQLATKAARGVRGLYHGVMGDEETDASKGQKTTASPEVANMGFTPEHLGYKAGEMVHGVGKFIKEGVQDIAGNTPVVIPDKGDTAGFADPKAHTLMAKYVTAPSQAERDASQDEMQKYFETQGPEAAGHAISAFLHGTLGEYVPAIGPLAMSLESQAQKGDIGGALAQVASLYAFEKGTGALKSGIKDRVNAKVEELTKTPEVKQAEENVQTLAKVREAAEAKHKAALAEHNKYQASHAQGIGSPEKVVNEVNKAKDALDEAEAHHELAKEDLAAKKAAQPTIPQQVGGAAGRAAAKVLPTPAPAPEVPTENVEAAPVLSRLGQVKPEPTSPDMEWVEGKEGSWQNVLKEPPALSKLGAKTPINVKTPGQIQPETFPQEPKPAPRPSYGRIALAGDQGVMGKPLQLTEGTPEGPKVPAGGLPKIKLPEPEAPKPQTGTAADLKALKAKEGKVIDTDETPEGRIGRLLQEALKTDTGTNKNFPAAKVEETPTENRAGERRVADEDFSGDERRKSERRVLKQMNDKLFQQAVSGENEGRIDTDAYAKAMEQARKELGPDASVKDVVKRRNELVAPEAKGSAGDIGDQARKANPEPTRAETKKPTLPNEEKTGYAAKKEEIVPAGVEGREPAKSASEYHPAVEQKVSELSDENLKKLAKAHGLNPDEYDFKARDERRHRVERDQLAKDITAQLGDDEKINLGRAAEATEKQGTFAGADVSAKGRAARAEKVFPRLRGPVDEYGNPKASGGAPDTDEDAERLKKHVAETSSKDTDHVQNAMKELGPDAKLSDIMDRAQKMKAEAAKPDLKKIVSNYNKTEGLGEVKDNKLEVDPRSKEIARAYDDMKHDPNNPEVKKSYAALIDDVKKQWDTLTKAGIKLEPQDEDPYKSYDEMKKDFNDNKRMKVFRGGEELPTDHPLAKVDPKTGETYNVMFRAVHDAVGHLLHDNDFSEKGESNAFDTHRQTMSKEAIPAMTTETKAQVASFFNNDNKFPEQKSGLLPDRLVEDAPDPKAVLDQEEPRTKPTFKTTNRHAEDLTYEHKPEGIENSNQQHRVTTLDDSGKKIGEVSAQDTAAGEVTVRSDQVYDKNLRGSGRGYDQMKHLLDRLSESKDVHTVHSDISNSTPERAVWEKLMKDSPEAITKKEFKDGQTQYTVDTEKYAQAQVPSVSGGSGKLPTGDQLIKKYGESDDPGHTAFILPDGRGVKNTGTIHDEMLGGKATDIPAPRERFIDEQGGIRMRMHNGRSGRQFTLSLPKDGITQDQLDKIVKMAPQMGTGTVHLETTAPGSTRVVDYAKASDDLENTVRDLVKIKDEGSPQSVGSARAGTSLAKESPLTAKQLQERLPDLAQQHLTPEEKEGITTTATGKPRNAGTEKFVKNMVDIPTIQEYIDIAKQGEGARKWYSRSTAAFDAMHEEAPDYFKEGDKQKFMGVLAGSSPQQSVAMNLRETLGFWKEWNDAGRPKFDLDKWKQFGEETDAAWKEDGSPRARGLAKGASQHWDYAPTGAKWKAENLLLKNLTLPETKVPNIIKALNGEQMWPDLTKNQAFKAPSFAENLKKWIGGESTGTKHVTNDSWMGLFGGIDKSALSKPENYHPLSVATRAAAEALGWEPEEAQAAIWSFTQALTERGTEDPELVRHYSEDFKDLLANDLETRDLLKGLGVNLEQLDSKLDTIGEKPEVSGRGTPTTAHSVGQLRGRIEEARGKGAIPEPKSVQGNLFKENPAFEHKVNPGAGHNIQPRDEATRFNPADFENEDSGLTKLGEKKKKSPLGTIR
jgi:hypothetical protein